MKCERMKNAFGKFSRIQIKKLKPSFMHTYPIFTTLLMDFLCTIRFSPKHIQLHIGCPSVTLFFDITFLC